MIVVNDNRHARAPGCGDDGGADELQLAVGQEDLCGADDDRRTLFFRRFQSGFEHIGINGVEEADGIVPLLCVPEYFIEADKHTFFLPDGSGFSRFQFPAAGQWPDR